MKPKSAKPMKIKHEFVELVPDQLEQGKLYISIPYETAVHLCACGCGIKVVTPISPPEWKLIWDGESVSLTPSIGNWQFPCRSHYCITRSRVVWARSLSEAEIAAGRRRDAADLDAYFESRRSDDVERQATKTEPATKTTLLHRLLRRLVR